jgi:hypothetical protein
MEMQCVSEGHTGSDEMSMVGLPVLKLTGDQNFALTKHCMEKQNAYDGESSGLTIRALLQTFQHGR